MREVALDLEHGKPSQSWLRAIQTKASQPRNRLQWLQQAVGLAVIAVLVVAATIVVMQLQAARLTSSNNNATAAYLSQVRGTQDAKNTALALTPSKTPLPTGTPKPSDKGLLIQLCGNDICLTRGGTTESTIPVGDNFFGIENGGMSFSPDGKQVVFAACELVEGNTFPCVDLYIVSASGGTPTSLPPKLLGSVITPAWSPDGQWIAYTNDADGGGLHLIKPDGTGKKQLFVYGVVGDCIMQIAWSADSQHLAVIGSNCGNSSEKMEGIWTLDVDGTNIHRLIRFDDMSANKQPLAWSVDGKSIAIQLPDNKTYLIPSDCTVSNPSCKIDQLPILSEFPIHWTKWFYPQWVDENKTPTP